MTLSWGRRGVLAAAAGAAAALALAAPAANAADDCSNAALRAAQNGAHLPECRAYELVSDPHKGGNEIMRGLPAISPEGGQVVYRNNSNFGNAYSNMSGFGIARRGTDGWVSDARVAPPFIRRPPTLGNIPTIEAVSPTFDSVIVSTSYPLSPDDQGSSAPAAETSNEDVYQWTLDGRLDWLSRTPVLPDTSRTGVRFLMASSDLTKVLVRGERPLDPEYPGVTGTQLYLIADKQQARLISKDPNGTPTGYTSQSLQKVWPTEDYSRILFQNDGDTLFVMDDATRPGAETFRPTFGPLRVPCDGLEALTADARKVLVSCRGREHPDPSVTDVGHFIADIDTGETTKMPVNGDVVAATDDFSHIYLLTSRAQGGQFVLVRDGEVTVIATITANTSFAQVRAGALSADGNQLAFQTDLPIGFPNGGFQQIFHYDAATDGLTCVSCPADGSDPVSAAQYVTTDAWEPGPGALSDNGRRIFFQTSHSLLPSDTNGRLDVYEWLDGELHLISTGTSPLDSEFAGATDDGSEVYFTTNDSLVPQDVDAGIGDLYVAKVGGGFAAASDVSRCTVDCQGPAKVLEGLQTPGTVSFTGPGDVDDAAEPGTIKVFSVAGIGTKTRAAWVRGRRAAVSVRLSHAGTATASMRARIGKRTIVVARSSRRAAAGGTVSLPLQLNSKARVALRRQGRLRVTVRVTVPGAGGAQRATFVLRAAKGGR